MTLGSWRGSIFVMMLVFPFILSWCFILFWVSISFYLHTLCSHFILGDMTRMIYRHVPFILNESIISIYPLSNRQKISSHHLTMMWIWYWSSPSWPGVFFSLVSMSPDTCTGESCSNRPFPPLYPLQFTLRFTVDSTILSKLESTFVIYSQSLNYIFQVSELDYLQNLKIFIKLFFKLMKLKVGTDHWHYQHEHHHHKVKLKCFIDFLLYFPLLVSDSVSTFAPTLFTGFSLAKDPKVSFWQSIWRTRRYSLLISDERVLYIMENIAPAVMNGIEIGIAIWKFILT